MTQPVQPTPDLADERPTLRGSLAALTLAVIGGYYLTSAVFGENSGIDFALGALFAVSSLGMIWRDRGRPSAPDSPRRRPAVAVLFGLAVAFGALGGLLERFTS